MSQYLIFVFKPLSFFFDSKLHFRSMEGFCTSNVEQQSFSQIWTSLICLRWFDIRIELIFNSAPGASKMTISSKVVNVTQK